MLYWKKDKIQGIDNLEKRERKVITFPMAAVFMAMMIGILTGLGSGYCIWGREPENTIDLKAVEMPDWVQQDFLRKNIFSRPDVTRRQVKNIVIHYVGNPGTSAKATRNYFDGLADQDAQKEGVSSSSHFVVGLDGEVIQCIPIDEVAYANAPRNDDTLSIEVCHADDTGKFNDASYESVVKLTAWLCKQLKLKSSDVVRHYDINGKQCPKYYVERSLETVKRRCKRADEGRLMEPSCKCHWHDTWICKKLCKKSGDAPIMGASPLFFRGILYNSGNHILLTFPGSSQSRCLKFPAYGRQSQW